MQINRLFETVYLLMDRKSMTARELAVHFEVSTRTILRDIDALAMAGIPVYTSQGKGGGIFLLSDYVLNKTLIPENEQKQILFALQSMAAAGHIETESILNRLRGLFRRKEPDWIEVDFSRWGFDATDKAKFDLLKDAIIGEQVLSFVYFGTHGTSTQRQVYPLKLVFKSRAWYLQAFCLLRQGYRLFKITRILNPVILNETFDAGSWSGWDSSSENATDPDATPGKTADTIADTNADTTANTDPSHYHPPGIIEVTLLFSPQAAYRVYDEFAEKFIVQNEDGSCIVTLCLPEDKWLYSFILSFGTQIDVLEPPHIRKAIAHQAELIKQKYVGAKPVCKPSSVPHKR